MKLKRVAALAMAGTMAVSLAACGGKTEDSNTTTTTDTQSATTDTEAPETQDGIISYADLDLDNDCKDLTASISFFNNRTDLDSDEYKGTTWKQYIEAFNKDFPNIEVKVLTSTNYAEDSLTHLQSGDYETVMSIPAVDKADLSTYFMSYGDLDTMKGQVNYADNWMYDNQVYGVPSTATTQGIVYNKKVFADAGVSSLPTTPDEFIDALKKIKDTV